MDDLFELKRIADKLMTRYPWHKGHGGIGVRITHGGLKLTGSSEAITVVMHSTILTEQEKERITYEITDDMITDL